MFKLMQALIILTSINLHAIDLIVGSSGENMSIPCGDNEHVKSAILIAIKDAESKCKSEVEQVSEWNTSNRCVGTYSHIEVSAAFRCLGTDDK